MKPVERVIQKVVVGSRIFTSSALALLVLPVAGFTGAAWADTQELGARKCDEKAAMERITELTRGLSTEVSPTVGNAKAIVAVALRCGSSEVSEYAAEVLARGLCPNRSPSREIAAEMERLCGMNERCAVRAVHSLARAVSREADPTIRVAQAIVRVVDQAPFDTVKAVAMDALAACLSANARPSRQCARAMERVNASTMPELRPVSR